MPWPVLFKCHCKVLKSGSLGALTAASSDATSSPSHTASALPPQPALLIPRPKSTRQLRHSALSFILYSFRSRSRPRSPTLHATSRQNRYHGQAPLGCSLDSESVNSVSELAIFPAPHFS